jgi:hypothetical protein
VRQQRGDELLNRDAVRGGKFGSPIANRQSPGRARIPLSYTGENMTIDERLERLAERHEALTQSLELFQHGTGEKIRALAAIAEQNEVRAAKIMDAIASQQARMARIETTAYRSFEDIRDSLQRLERIAIAHERRLEEIQS